MILAALVPFALIPILAAAPKPKTTPKPKATATAAAAATPNLPVDAGPERPISTGNASCKLGTKSLSFENAGGSFQTSGPYQIASVKFKGKKGMPQLELDFMYQGTGPIDQTLITNVFAIDDDKPPTVSAFRSHVSSCTIELAKATPNMVEGTASCTKGMFNEDKPGRPITEIKFRAESTADAPKEAKQ